MRIEAGTDLMRYIQTPWHYLAGGKVEIIANVGGYISEWTHPEGYESLAFKPDDLFGDDANYVSVHCEEGVECFVPGISISF